MEESHEQEWAIGTEPDTVVPEVILSKVISFGVSLSYIPPRWRSFRTPENQRVYVVL